MITIRNNCSCSTAKCTKTLKAAHVTCKLCDRKMNCSCMGYDEDLAKKYKDHENFFYFCNACSVTFQTLKNLNCVTEAVKDSHNKLMAVMEGIASDSGTLINENKLIKDDIAQIKKSVPIGGDTLISHNELQNEIATLKRELKSGWVEAVKKISTLTWRLLNQGSKTSAGNWMKIVK